MVRDSAVVLTSRVSNLWAWPHDVVIYKVHTPEPHNGVTKVISKKESSFLFW